MSTTTTFSVNYFHIAAADIKEFEQTIPGVQLEPLTNEKGIATWQATTDDPNKLFMLGFKLGKVVALSGE